MDKTRVLLAEDHTIVRKGLRSLLDKETGIKVVGEAEDGREAIAKAEELHPDVVVMDIAMPRLNGLEATRQIKKRFPDMKILILTMHTNEEYVLQTLNAGASGYLVKKAAPAELISAINAVHKGDSFLSPSISRTVIDEYIRRSKEISEGAEGFEQLTVREREVLQLIAEGHKTREIAELLYISIKTVETHRAHIMNKLDIHSTAELTRYAIRKGIISSDT
ncbi:MAG: response regulator transcription factor [Desulfobacterales bacterium]|nr:response regulator transcription factor [Desulfobacterales bacterium]